MVAPTDATPSPRRCLALGLALSLGGAISLGVTRFSYALLLPPMRADLGWSYTLAGAMNTANAAGYLLGALATPRLMRVYGPGRTLLAGAALASVFMAASGLFTEAAVLLTQRLLAGVASALVFMAGGLMAARLGALQPRQAGLLIGLYYGGTGWGIVLSALLVPAALDAAQARPHGWAWAWWALALACAAATAALWRPVRTLDTLGPRVTVGSPAGRFGWGAFGFALAAYGLFGVGYIGYMTFVIALLREQGATRAETTVFYCLLGLAVVASARLWARLLDRFRGGQPLAILSALLAAATVTPALTAARPAVLASGVLFGAVFLSVVASTTALVRHNLPPAAWPAGIGAFTVVFAAGQIVGPTVVGLISDGPGGLQRGLLYSALALAAGAGLALWQKPLLLPAAAPAPKRAA